MSHRVEPFTIAIEDAVLDDLRERLRQTRFPADFANDEWEQGFSTAYLRELVAYWLDGFDWRAQERRINELSHFTTEIDGVPIHFVHQKGVGPDPMPLLIHHGWPWTFWDLNKVIEPLADPARFGGDPGDAFDVVLISLPGHGFSSPLRQTGWNFHRTAELERTLMKEVLGYDRFAVAGGDWGAMIGAQLGHAHAQDLIGFYCHCQVPISDYLDEHPDFPADMEHEEGWPVASEFAPDERAWAEKNAAFGAGETGYGWIQLTRPQTVAVGLHDSPAGQLAWIAEKRRSWADTGGEIESVWTKDDLLTAATIYWATETAATSARYYKETILNPWRPSHDRWPVVETPTAVAVFPGEIMIMPRRWAERYYDLRQYTLHERGGHFAPAEVPEAWLADLRRFFRTLR